MSSPSPLRAAVYLRVSSDKQSTECQRPEVEHLARARGYKVFTSYEEEASAAKKRPEHERMMKDAKRGAFQVLVIWALDRFGRSMTGNLADVLELDRVGVQVVSVRESWLDTGSPVRTLLIAIFSWVAEQERNRQIGRRSALAVRPNGVPKLLRSGTRSFAARPPFRELLARRTNRVKGVVYMDSTDRTFLSQPERPCDVISDAFVRRIARACAGLAAYAELTYPSEGPP